MLASRARVLLLKHNIMTEFDDVSDISRFHKVRAVPAFLFIDEGAVVSLGSSRSSAAASQVCMRSRMRIALLVGCGCAARVHRTTSLHCMHASEPVAAPCSCMQVRRLSLRDIRRLTGPTRLVSDCCRHARVCTALHGARCHTHSCCCCCCACPALHTHRAPLSQPVGLTPSRPPFHPTPNPKP